MISTTRDTSVAEIAGVGELWAETLGDPRICIAVLDGPVDRSHPGLAAANLSSLDTLALGIANQGAATRHGTHVASVLFGQHDGPVLGIAPRCRGLVVPVFGDGPDNSLAPCSQLDLARAISQAVEGGAHIINISGGEISPSGTAQPILAGVVQKCVEQGVLIVAAAGNEGCDCLHVPGGLPSVLAVGAMDSHGEPLAFSNWGESYQVQGILAPGENIVGASPGGTIEASSGTSYAASIVSGIAALLMSLRLKRGQVADARAVRSALIDTAIGCDDQPATECRRLLAGRLNVKGAMSRVMQGGTVMTDSTAIREGFAEHTVTQAGSEPSVAHTMGVGVLAEATSQGEVLPSESSTSSCGCGKGEAPASGRSVSAQLVYALGQLGFDFGTEAPETQSHSTWGGIRVIPTGCWLTSMKIPGMLSRSSGHSTWLPHLSMRLCRRVSSPVRATSVYASS